MAKEIKSKYTDVPVKDIANGVIVLDNNQKVTGVKIMPRNIFILEQTMQDAIIMNLKNVYNAIDYEFWLLVADRPVDINMYLAQLQLMYNNAQNQQIRKIISQDIDKGEMFRSTTVNAVDTDKFIYKSIYNGLKKSNSSMAFVQKFIREGNDDEFITNSELYEIYASFCHENALAIHSRQKLFSNIC